MAAKKKTTAKTQETTLRHLWLAGLGLAAVARRETLNAANDAVAKVESFKKQAEKLANETQANVRGGFASVREQGEATVGQFEARVGQFSAEVEARLAPVLVKLGLMPDAGKAKRSRKTVKKTVKKTVAKRTPARKPATKRSVRKTRA